jgi:uncharacterized SAM-binding protein YcdF (DUF218 family)
MTLRTAALLLGLFTLANLGAPLIGGVDGNIYWIDVRGLARLGSVVLLLGAFAMIGWALRPACPALRRSTTVVLLVLLLVTLLNTATYFALWSRGVITAAVPLPLSLLLALLLAGMIWRLYRPAPPVSWRLATGQAAATVAAAVLLFPLMQMVLLGRTDYRRPAEAVVVLGARAYADGRPSDALADRVRTACELYHEGYVRRLIFSGGPGDGDIHETEAMRQMAFSLGVPDRVIVLDQGGLNTSATAANTATLLGDMRGGVLAVSHASTCRACGWPTSGWGSILRRCRHASVTSCARCPT